MQFIFKYVHINDTYLKKEDRNTIKVENIKNKRRIAITLNTDKKNKKKHAEQ